MRRFISRRLVFTYVAIAVLLGAGGFIWARQSGAAVEYRTAVATLGTVTQSVALSGNLVPAAETDLDFTASGRVSSINVTPGQQVAAGQVLASLDTTTLQGSLTQAQATLTSAEARLSQDEQGTTPTSLAQAQAQVNTAQVSLQNATTAYNDTVAVNQTSITQSQAQLEQDENSEHNDCTANATSVQCQSDQQKLNTDEANLSAAQAKAQQSDDQAQAQLTSAQVSLQNAKASLAALQQGATPEQIQQDQAQVQIDEIAVNTAQTSLDGATITAPVTGMVAQVNVVAGQQVSGGASSSSASGSAAGGATGAAGAGAAGGSSSASTSGSSSSSTTHAVVLVTPGVFQVTGSVSDAQVNEIAVGQPAQVLPAGSPEAVTGKVASVAPVATVSSGVATFPVTVMLNGTNNSLRAGMSASVNVVVNQVVQVLTVPTSTVHSSGSGSIVQVLVNGQPQSRAVTVGAADANRTQILSGLNQGDQVVLATITSNVPSSSTGGAGGGRGGLGGSGGGVFFGGGGRSGAGGGSVGGGGGVAGG